MIAEFEGLLRRTQAWFSRSGWGTRLLGRRAPRAQDARGVLLVELEGLTLSRLEQLLSSGSAPFVGFLIQSQEYRLFPLLAEDERRTPPPTRSAPTGLRAGLMALLWSVAALAGLLRRVLEDRFRPSQQRLPPLLHLRREMAAASAEVGLVLGHPVVLARFPYVGAGRTLRRLRQFALASRLRHYELWLCSAADEPFVCLPLTIPPPVCGVSGLLEHARRRVEAKVLLGLVEARRPAVDCLRVMTYNVHGCVGTDGRLSPGRIAQVVAEHTPHLLALQELDCRRGRSGFIHQAQEIASRLEMEFHFHPSMEVDDGSYGNAVLSRLPLRLVKAGPLPHPGRPLEPRGAIWVEVEWDGCKLQLINTHLGLLRAERMLQVSALLGPDWVQSRQCRPPVVLLGDFNAGQGSPEHQRLTELLQDANRHSQLKTWFGRYPLQTLDHVFLSQNLQVLAVEAPRTPLTVQASDHLPLIVDLRVLPGTAAPDART